MEADPDVAAAMDILSFALYHENNKVVGEDTNNDASMVGNKRSREEPDLTDASDVDENDPQRQRVEEDATANSSSPQQEQSLDNLKAAIYQEVSKSLEDSISADDVCVHVDDRALVAQAIASLEEDGKIMMSDGEVFLVD